MYHARVAQVGNDPMDPGEVDLRRHSFLTLPSESEIRGPLPPSPVDWLNNTGGRSGKNRVELEQKIRNLLRQAQ